MKDVKSTQLLADAVRIIARGCPSLYCKSILEEAAQRLEDIEKIAEYYRKKAEEGAEDSGRRKMDKTHHRHVR